LLFLSICAGTHPLPAKVVWELSKWVGVKLTEALYLQLLSFKMGSFAPTLRKIPRTSYVDR